MVKIRYFIAAVRIAFPSVLFLNIEKTCENANKKPGMGKKVIYSCSLNIDRYFIAATLT
jgi:hypothetical protein